ncbi:MAG: glycoside hydrolase family 15 protein [Patescibacteria group bacterium]
MAKALTIGNGRILLNLDEHAQVRDLYFPYIGLENQVGGRLVHRMGVWVDGVFSFLDDGGWKIEVKAEKNVLAGEITALHKDLELSLFLNDLVYNEKDIFVRKILIKNLAYRERKIKIFFGHQFELTESTAAHTAYYNPSNNTIIHYRNQRAVLINAQLEGRAFDDFSTGVFGIDGKEGTQYDAIDGVLEKNPIEHGPADSFIGLTGIYKADETKILYYWLTVATSIKEATELNDYVLAKGAGHLVETTQNYWQAWVTRENFNFHGLAPDLVRLFNQSLLMMRAHAGTNGAIIASGDSNALQKGKDTYAYVWPRDAAFTALALIKVGDSGVAKTFFSFCNKVISDEGYLMHKYSPDGSPGSSWHPWFRNGQAQLPIQEDETALVLYALWEYYLVTKDLEFIEEIYNSLIRKTADFMVLYRDSRTGLPKPSYDLWEEKWGVATFTASAVYGALTVASDFAKLLGKIKNEDTYRRTAREVKEAILRYLYDDKRGIFYKMLSFNDDELVYDETIDASSVFGIYEFKVLPPDDERLRRALQTTEQATRVNTSVGGIARYAGDIYYQVDKNTPGNPWFVPTLWTAGYLIDSAKNEKDLEPVIEIFRWALKYSSSSGILSEQLNPHTGEALSVAPLVWSHAEYVRAVIKYLAKLAEFDKNR